MNGFMNRRWAALGLAGGLALAGGCETYRNLVDPCWPERYSYQSRQSVVGHFAPQVHNGHVLAQTVMNWHFEPGTDKLTPAGLEYLAALARRRPYPDSVVYLQTAQDVAYDPAAPDKLASERANLDAKRIQAVQNYLGAQTAGRGLGFEVIVHDPGPVGQSAAPVGIAVQRMNAAAQGALPSSGGGGGGGGVSVSPASGGGGGGR